VQSRLEVQDAANKWAQRVSERWGGSRNVSQREGRGRGKLGSLAFPPGTAWSCCAMERGEAGEWAGQTGFAARPNERGRAEAGNGAWAAALLGCQVEGGRE
jgi:hypothetical protein